MKKILLSSIILFLFSVSIVLFQISCKKEAVAEVVVSGTGGSNLGLILFKKIIKISVDVSETELWTSSYDGTNRKKIPVVTPNDIPAGTYLDLAQLSPDGKTVFITYSKYQVGSFIYSCALDGSNLKKIIGSDKLGEFSLLQGVY
ncbi:MAG: hypothetical protein EAY66_05385 [Sphingobacteriales bacterium]|nr:MAG: hypothetical protein EAY66_05385 [Sphingobacteriales bacterium]